MFVRGVQTLPHRPQLALEVESGTSQPLAATPSQSPKPALHVNVHTLAEPHRAIEAFVGAVQGSVRVVSPSSLHTDRDDPPAGQVVVPGVHVQLMQVVPLHVDIAGQAMVVALVPVALQTRTVRASMQVELPGAQARSTQLPRSHRCEAPQGVSVVPKPSALQRLRTVVERQLTAPGVQVRATQVPPVHPSPDAHETVVVDSPSAAHTRRSVIDAQVAVPGAHTRATQLPDWQDSVEAQGIAVYPPPSSLQRRRSIVAGSQLVVPGVQVGAWHVPIRHVCPMGQSLSDCAAPRLSQLRTLVAVTHSRAPAVHTLAAQVDVAAQNCIAVQSVSATQSTHTLRARSQTWAISEQSRDERQVRGGATQTLDRQIIPRQSASVSQSTQ